MLLKELLTEQKIDVAKLFGEAADIAKDNEHAKRFFDRFFSGKTAYSNQLPMFQAAIDNNTIWNVDYNELKDGVFRVLENSYEQVFENFKIDGDSWTWHQSKATILMKDQGIDSWDLDRHISGTNYKKQIRLMDRLTKIKTFPEEMIAHFKKLESFLKVYGQLREAYVMLKPVIVKGRKPNTNVDPNKFTNKPGSKESQDVVRNHLTTQITPLLDLFEQDQRASIEKLFQHFVSKKKISMKEVSGYDTFIIQHMIDFAEAGNYQNREFVVKGPAAKASEWADKQCAQSRKIIEETFLLKNIKKISSIVDAKGNLDKIEDKGTYVGKGVIEATTKFLFTDGAHFTVVNKVVTKFSPRNHKPFYQFPTTFHDVVKADGTKVSYPSEEKVVKLFTA